MELCIGTKHISDCDDAYEVAVYGDNSRAIVIAWLSYKPERGGWHVAWHQPKIFSQEVRDRVIAAVWRKYPNG